MAKSQGHVYNIKLDVTTPQASKQALKELQTAFETSNKDMSALNSTYAELVKNTKDITGLEKQYNKIVAQRLSEKDNEIEKLQAEKVAIAANTKLSKAQKKEMIEAADNGIKQLKTEKKHIKAREKEAKLLAKVNKVFHANADESSKTYKVIKSTVAVQEKLNSLLGKESKLRKTIAKVANSKVAAVGKAGLKVGKAGVKAMGGALAIGGAIAGAATASAGDIAEKERTMASLKSGIDPSIVDSVYIKSGADYATIVDAVNRLSSVTKDSAQLIQGAVLEVQNPGIGKLLLSQNKMNGNTSQLANAIAQIKRQTGAQDLSAALEASTKARLVTTGAISQTDYLQAYSALAQTGLDEERIERIIRNVASKKGEFITNLNKEDLSKYVSGQGINLLKNQKLNLSKLDLDKETTTSSAQSITEKLRAFELKKNEMLVKFLPVVETILEKLSGALKGDTLAKIADGFVSLLTSVIPALDPLFELLDAALTALKPVMEALQPIMGTVVVPALKWVAELATSFVETFVGPLTEGIASILQGGWRKDKDGNEGGNEDGKSMADIAKSIAITAIPIARVARNLITGFEAVKNFAGGGKAQGGIVSAPTIVGEAGPELVLPLDYSRAGRASSIINNFNTSQSFNMSANQTTPLAFSQAVGTNRFVKRFAK